MRMDLQPRRDRMARRPTRKDPAPRYVPRAPMEPARALATAVLRQVVLDLQRGGDVRTEALRWLQGSRYVQVWCDMIDMDAARFRRLVLQRQGRARPCT